jgi:large subunit ribosomal protein L2
MQVKDIPVGMEIHCIEMTPKSGASLVRSAGQYAILRNKEEKYAQVKLSNQDDEIRKHGKVVANMIQKALNNKNQ